MIVIFGVIGLCFALSFCAKKQAEPETAAVVEAANPFFEAYGTPFETPPFDRIRDEHYMPAFREGMARQMKEIEAVVANPEPPTFANTVEAVERSGALLTRVANVFFCLTEGNTNPVPPGDGGRGLAPARQAPRRHHPRPEALRQVQGRL